MRVKRDVHPAEVSCPDGRVVTGRVFVTDDRLIVWAEPERHRAVRVLDVELTDPQLVPACNGTLQGSLECATGEGTYWVNKARGCGCGQLALKALTPAGAIAERQPA